MHTQKNQKYCSAECGVKAGIKRFSAVAKTGKYLSRQKAWYEANKKEVQRKQKERRDSRPTVRLATILRTRLGHAIQGRSKSAPTLSYIGCTVEHLRAHIEALWLPGMNWENYGPRGWHIDHRQPLAAFNLFNEEGIENTAQIQAAMHYTNLQPLWAVDNIRKGASLTAS